MVRPATTALQNLLASWGPDVNIKMADLYTFSLEGGENLRYSSWQQPLAGPGPNTNSPTYQFVLGPPIERTKIIEKIGTEVSHIDITIYAGPDDLLGLGGDLTWQAALRAGLFDGAWCKVWRAYITPPATVVGTISRFFGRVGDVEIGRTKTRIQVNSLLDLLTTQMPRRLFQAACTHVFGGRDANDSVVGMCGYDRVNGLNALGVMTGIGAANITAAAGTSQNCVYTNFSPSPTTIYDNGSIVGVTGANAGYSRTIGQLNSLQSPHPIYFLKPFIFPANPGDQFQLLPGCDHTYPTCKNTFQNQLRFGGFPDIPPPESAV
jgi:uncharacterized phage protein (TIGR02218 family)